jgi:hypothetical protein
MPDPNTSTRSDSSLGCRLGVQAAALGPPTIPRISHDIPHPGAFRGIWLHIPDTNQGHRGAPEQRF